MRDFCRIPADFPAFSRIASAGAGARMRFSRRILAENLADSRTISAGIPAYSRIGSEGVYARFTA
jgi:hypothetical protein